MRVFGLIGYPLTHSFSRKHFTDKFLREGIKDCVYENFEFKNLTDLKKRLPDSLAGINITIPFKEQVLEYLDDANTIVKETSACNCIRIQDGFWKGFNTDVLAFERSFTPLLNLHHKKALILGTGGASKAVSYVLRKLGIDYLFVSTGRIGTGILGYNLINPEIMKEYHIIINTTPLGTFPDEHICPSIPYDHITRAHYLYDLVYNPSKTLFLSRGEAMGAKIKNGYEMLESQAEESWKIWNEYEDLFL